MMLRTLVSLVALGLFTAGCSSASTDGVPAADTGPGEDTGATETEPTDTAPALPEYPPGPYGLAAGNTFPNLEFEAYKDGTGEWTKISLRDFYDPDGSRGITGLYLVVAAQWCPPCNEEADVLGKASAYYKSRGGRFFSVVTQDRAGNPATRTTVDQWVKAHKVNFDIGLDSKSSSLPKTGSVGLPYNYVIDPRTMKVRVIKQGMDPFVFTCKTNADCCAPDDTRSACLYKGAPQPNQYACQSATSLCIPEGTRGVVSQLDALMSKNGAK